MMSQEHFEAEVRRIEEEHARRREGADAYRDQEMARLFGTCDWSQERIARAMGKKQQWVSQRLTFGRFLSFTASGGNHKPSLMSLTERRFRDAWKKTAGKERDRFADVLRYLNTEGHTAGTRRQLDKPGIRAAIREALSDGKWKSTRELQALVAARLPDVPPSCVSDGMHELLRARPAKGFFFEAKHAGRTHQYRMRKGVPVPEGGDLVREVTRLRDGVGPIIEELKHWGRSHEAQMSPVAIRRIAFQLEKLFGRLLEPAAR